jgi:hypothetical protein
MAERSIFSPGGSGMTRGGLDRYLSPSGIDDSRLPESITDPSLHAEPEVPVDCDGADKDTAVCQIARAERDLGSAPPTP